MTIYINILRKWDYTDYTIICFKLFPMRLFTTRSYLHISPITQTSQNVRLSNMSAVPRGEDPEAKNHVLIILYPQFLAHQRHVM